MPLDIGPLRELPVRRTTLTVYFRQVWLPSDGSDPDPFFMRREGRWPTDWTLYTSTTPAVAWAEYCRNHPHDVAAADVTGGVGLDDAALAVLGAVELEVPARALFELDFAFDTLADLTSDWALELLARAGFRAESFTADPPGYGDCPELAALAEQLGPRLLVELLGIPKCMELRAQHSQHRRAVCDVLAFKLCNLSWRHRQPPTTTATNSQSAQTAPGMKARPKGGAQEHPSLLSRMNPPTTPLPVRARASRD